MDVCAIVDERDKGLMNSVAASHAIQNPGAFNNWPDIWEPYLWIWNILIKSRA
jgi:hypothetical protein